MFIKLINNALKLDSKLLVSNLVNKSNNQTACVSLNSFFSSSSCSANAGESATRPASTSAKNSSLYQLRKNTGYAFNKCKEALDKCGGNVEQVYLFIPLFYSTHIWNCYQKKKKKKLILIILVFFQRHKSGSKNKRKKKVGQKLKS